MTVFLPTLSQMGFLFAFILIGYLLVKLRVLDSGAAGVLSKLENNLFIPALVMGTFINYFTVPKLKELGLLFLASCALLAVVIPFALLSSKALCPKDKYISRIFAYGLCFSNFGFMGNAVVKALFRDIFMQYLVFTLPLWSMIYIWGVPALLIAEDGHQTLKQKLKSFLNPMFIALLIGMLLGITGLGAKLPTFVTSVITVSGDCMSPVAMLLTGMIVAEIDLKSTFTNLRIYAVSVVRLLVFPLVFLAICLLFPHVNRTFLICATCSLAMPLGLNSIVVPRAYGKDTSAAAGMALVSHVLSCATIPVIFLLLEKFFPVA